MDTTISIMCLKCKCKTSYIKHGEDGSEYGVCTKCGSVTYRKMSDAEKTALEKDIEEQAAAGRKIAFEQSTRLEKNRIQLEEYEAYIKRKNKPTITCPYCHSTNVEKITMGKRVVKGWLWGAAAANTLVKEWHCKNCKSNF